MTLELKSIRKVAVIGWDTKVVKGTDASISAHGQEKRNVKNDGESNIFYPADFAGSTEVTVTGSHGGSETALIVIPGVTDNEVSAMVDDMAVMQEEILRLREALREIYDLRLTDCALSTAQLAQRRLVIARDALEIPA